MPSSKNPSKKTSFSMSLSMSMSLTKCGLLALAGFYVFLLLQAASISFVVVKTEQGSSVRDGININNNIIINNNNSKNQQANSNSVVARNSQDSGSSSNNNSNNNSDEILYAMDEPLHVVRQLNTPASRTTAAVYVCTKRYGSAVASSAVSLRHDGGYRNDIIIIMEPSSGFSNTSMQQKIIQHHDAYHSSVKPADAASNSSADFLEGETVEELLEHIHIYSTEYLWDLLNLTPEHLYLRRAPSPGQCFAWHRKMGHAAYYLKTLVFHPLLANRYDTIALMDACQTYHSPHVPEILHMPEIQGHLLAAPDPWLFGWRMLGGRVMHCATPRAMELLHTWVGHDLNQSSYFTTGFVVFDAVTLVRNYGPDPSTTLLELLRVYHELGSSAFEGDQLIWTVYWMYIRQNFQIIPYALQGSPRVPYEFLKRMPQEPYIITAGNSHRKQCAARPSAKYEALNHHHHTSTSSHWMSPKEQLEAMYQKSLQKAALKMKKNQQKKLRSME